MEKGRDMNRKNVILKVEQNDLLEKKKQVIFNGQGQIDMSLGYKIYYQEDQNTKVSLHLEEKKGLLSRDGEALTEINFNLEAIDQCKVSTDVGDIFMDVNTLKISNEGNSITLHYELLEAGAVVGRFQLRMEWENEQNWKKYKDRN